MTPASVWQSVAVLYMWEFWQDDIVREMLDLEYVRFVFLEELFQNQFCFNKLSPEIQGHGIQGHGVQGHGVQGHGVQGHGLQGHGLQGHGIQGHQIRCWGEKLKRWLHVIRPHFHIIKRHRQVFVPSEESGNFSLPIWSKVTTLQFSNCV